MTKAKQAKSKKAKSGKNRAADEDDGQIGPNDDDLNDADYTGDEGEGEDSDDASQGDGVGHDTTAAGASVAEEFYEV